MSESEGKQLHYCPGWLPDGAYGEAITDCQEEDDGTFWIGNREYASQVGFCPYCGAKAKTLPKVVLFDTNCENADLYRSLGYEVEIS